MSTRCNVILKVGSSSVYFYRHYDGYLAEAGADLVKHVQAAMPKVSGAWFSEATAADKFLRSLLAANYDDGRGIYELTTDLHGDIEFAYVVEFKSQFNTGNVSIRVSARPASWSDDDLEVDDWAFGGKRYSLPKFIKAVNDDRKACNARIAKIKADRPGNKWAQDLGEYEMLEAEEA